MSLLPGEKLRYAETHFKFKLPWSLLYRPWPEIIFDAAFQAVPGTVPTLWIVVRDADRFPVTLDSAEIEIKSPFERVKKKVSLKIKADKPLEFFPIPLHELKPGAYKIMPTVKATRLNANGGKGETRSFTRWNLPGLKPAPLTLTVLAQKPPIAPGFVAGEMHCHTHYSRDHVEYGATPAILQQAAKNVGLDFVCCTDHAYDFAFTDEDYTKEAESPVPRFQKLRDEIAALPSDDGEPLLLAGEEISAGNSKKENVHVLMFAPDGYLPGLGDCGRYWLENKPTLSIPQVLKNTQAHCFAAHPFQQMGIVEKFVFRRGYWTHKDLNLESGHSIRGLQFWNGVRDEGFKLGREFWIEELGKGNFLLPIGGNDAHGDLNDTTAVSTPLVSLKHSRDHVFGKVRTAILLKTPEGSEEQPRLSLDALNAAFAGDNCYITDGPALWWERSGKLLLVHARNTPDFGGGFRYIRIYGRRYLTNGKLAQEEEICMESLIAAPQSADISVYVDNFAYLRAECETASGKFAMTSAARFERG